MKRLVLGLLAVGVGTVIRAENPQSAAMQRHVVDDSENEFYTRFRYRPVTGLGYEEGVSRRYPSSTIKVGDLYYTS